MVVVEELYIFALISVAWSVAVALAVATDRRRSMSPWRGLAQRDILYKHRVRSSFVNIMDQCMKSDSVYFV